jgi:hypothetical protein
MPRFAAARWILIVAAVLAAAASAGGQSPSGILSPNTAAKGLTMQVDTRWVAGSGYRPVRVELRPVVPLVETRTVDLIFRARSWYRRQRESEVAQSVDIPPGVAKVSVTLSAPEHSIWQNYDLEVVEDGRPIEKLSQLNVGLGNWNADALEAVPAMLVVGTHEIDTSRLCEALKARGLMAQYRASLGGVQSITTSELTTVTRRELAELPGRWIDYSSLDVVCLSSRELKQLADQQPGRWKAIRAWTAAGGNLWVYGAGEDWHGLKEIESALAMAVEQEADSSDPVARGWILPDRSTFREELESGFSENVANWPEDQDASTIGPNQKFWKVAPLNDFVTRPCQLGMVVAFSSSDLFSVDAAPAGDAFVWRWRLNTIGADRLLWVRRHGLSTRRENNDFWNFLVPGVGLVPVTAFRVLITVFMVAIGPLNYWWLRRKGRLHLLLVIVPVAAAVITGTLFGYAVVADGFDVRVRARSFTHLDQRTGHAVCWSRLSYYAGLAPSSGLIFSGDVAVLPLDSWGTGADAGTPARRMRWYDDNQMLADGWLASRTSTQFVTVRSRASTRGVDLLQSNGQSQVRNRLGCELKMFVTADHDGSLLVARSVADGVTAALRPADPDADLAELRSLLADQRVEVPVGLDPQRYSLFGMRSYTSYSQWNNTLPNPSQNTSLLEHRLQNIALWWPPEQSRVTAKSYLAVVDRSPEVLFGTEPVKEEASLHVIVGEW